MSLNKNKYKDVLTGICSDYCSKDTCILKEFLISAHSSPRLLMQMKGVEKFKNTLAQEKGVDILKISWSEAMSIWVENGYAEVFSNIYIS